VPGFFGDKKNIISLLGEKATHLRMPDGSEDRICTYVLEFCADGSLISPVIVIFKGTGKRVKADDMANFAQFKDVHVLWQKKAWIDTKLEREVLMNQHRVEIKRKKKEYADRNAVYPGAYLIHDAGPGHDDVYASFRISPTSFDLTPSQG
jgi:hypothetical protein